MIVGHIGGASAPYEIEKSLRLRSGGYLTRSYTNATPDTDTKRKTYHIRAKRGSLGVAGCLLSNSYDSNNFWALSFENSDQLSLYNRSSGTYTLTKTTARAFRDPSEWLDVVVAIDTTLATAEDRFALSVNGERVLGFSPNTIAAQNSSAMAFFAPASGTWVVNIGRTNFNAANLFDGLVADVHVIDGQALGPEAFGEFDAFGKWVPKKYAGTYGNNGFWLPFDDGTNLTELCRDRSGNGEDFTANGVSLTTGATYDWFDDTPTNNFAVLNPLVTGAAGATISEGNLRATFSASVSRAINVNALGGKWYCEFSPLTVGDCWGGLNSLYRSNGQRWNGSAYVAYGAAYTVGDIIGCAADIDGGTVEFFKNGVSQGTMPTLSGPEVVANVYGNGGNISVAFNFGQRPFSYTPPAGYKALCGKSLPAPTGAAANPKAHMTVATYVGDGAFQTIYTDANGDPFEFNAGLIWTKSRASTTSHILSGHVDGNQGYLVSHSTAGAVTPSTAPYMSGLELAVDATLAGTNVNLASYVAWLFKMGNSFVANVNGSISSQVSANVAGGMSVVKYTGTGANATVGHGLGVAPKLVIIKRLDGISGWQVGHDDALWTKYLRLDLTDAATANATAWNNTAPTSNVFSLGSGTIANTSGAQYVAICFAEVPGFSKIGSYTGNGSADGPFVYCGFKPRYLLVKNASSATYSWCVIDTARNPSNLASMSLFPNLTNAEGSGGMQCDFTSTGFKVRASGPGVNASGSAYDFLAISERHFTRCNAQ